MGDVLISIGGGGGTTSDDVTTTKDKVLVGYTTLMKDSDDEPVGGTMPNNGTQSGTLNCGQSKTIPSGFTSGGTVTANSLASQTGGATLADGEALSGRTFWKDGAKRSGTMPDRGAPAHSLPINGTQYLAAGRYTGGYVTQSIPTFGGQTIAPNASAQTVSIAGKYATGNVVINPVSLPNAGDLRQGVNWYGRVGTMVDYSYLLKGQTSF